MIELTLQISTHEHDIWIAKLYQFGIDNFLEDEEQLKCFVEKSQWEFELCNVIIPILRSHRINYTINQLDVKDWNKEWESNFEPILIEPYLYIHASFHPLIPEIKHSILIAPKMAFGTGHHSTTSMILRWMLQVDFRNKDVLDFGCGTGILGIYASLKECNELVLIDNDPNSIENSEEHCLLNHIKNVQIYLGSTDQIPAQKFDFIFANITRNVLEECMSDLKTHLAKDGNLVISGFLKSDEEFMRQLIKSHGLKCQETMVDKDWLAMNLTIEDLIQ
ncbi:MAG: 50S ribosomal protein L11 methyltransferase [Saprospiraceae bacterium]|nr:50S ribosomal protein L11 methyltransferase [Saprospiraceae bacterium]